MIREFKYTKLIFKSSSLHIILGNHLQAFSKEFLKKHLTVWRSHAMKIQLKYVLVLLRYVRTGVEPASQNSGFMNIFTATVSFICKYSVPWKISNRKVARQLGFESTTPS